MSSDNYYTLNGEDEKYMNRFQTIIFKFMNPLIGNELFGSYFKLLLIIIECIQMISFAFSDPVRAGWKYANADYIHKGFGFTLILPFLKDSGGGYLAAYILSILIIFFIFLLIVYSLYFPKSNKRIKNLTWNETAIKFFIEIHSQVLFLPLFNILIAVFMCENQNGVSVMKLNSEYICLQGNHLLLFIFSAILIGPYVLLALIISLFYNDLRYKNDSLLARYSSQGELISIFFKIVVSITFISIDSSQDIIGIFIYTVFGYIVFDIFNSNLYYHNIWVDNIIVMQWALILWSGIMVTFNRIFIDTQFDANIILYIIGFVSLVLMCNLKKNVNYNMLLLKIATVTSVDKGLSHCRYLIKFFGQYSKGEIGIKSEANRRIAMLIDGFIEFHKTVCMEENCPTNKNWRITKKQRRIFEG